MNARGKFRSFQEVFTNPDKIIDYSKENWSFIRFTLIIIIAGALFGYNFFWTTFILVITPPMIIWALGMLFLGILILDIFIYLYIFILWLSFTILLKIMSKNESPEKKSEKIDESLELIKKENLFSWIKVFSYCFLIPFLIYNFFEFILTVFFLSLNMPYVAVYIKDYGKFLLYAWILSLTLYSTHNIDKTQKYKVNAIILISFLITYGIVFILTFYGVAAITNLI